VNNLTYNIPASAHVDCIPDRSKASQTHDSLIVVIDVVVIIVVGEVIIIVVGEVIANLVAFLLFLR
jgi:hypothetical protein